MGFFILIIFSPLLPQKFWINARDAENLEKALRFGAFTPSDLSFEFRRREGIGRCLLAS